MAAPSNRMKEEIPMHHHHQDHQPRKNIPCRWFVSGGCKYGRDCWYNHTIQQNSIYNELAALIESKISIKMDQLIGNIIFQNKEILKKIVCHTNQMAPPIQTQPPQIDTELKETEKMYIKAMKKLKETEEKMDIMEESRETRSTTYNKILRDMREDNNKLYKENLKLKQQLKEAQISINKLEETNTYLKDNVKRLTVENKQWVDEILDQYKPELSLSDAIIIGVNTRSSFDKDRTVSQNNDDSDYLSTESDGSNMESDLSAGNDINSKQRDIESENEKKDVELEIDDSNMETNRNKQKSSQPEDIVDSDSEQSEDIETDETHITETSLHQSNNEDLSAENDGSNMESSECRGQGFSS